VDAEAHVRIQPLALQQVVLNLMLNAMTALHGRRGELRIDVAERADGMTQIRIADNGPGIDKTVAETLFEPFVTSRPGRDRGDRTGGQGGSGLGLAICKRLIEDAGGTIEVGPGWFASETSSGPGATFTITMPAVGRDGNQKAA